jgi:hypothetical protein
MISSRNHERHIEDILPVLRRNPSPPVPAVLRQLASGSTILSCPIKHQTIVLITL